MCDNFRENDIEETEQKLNVLLQKTELQKLN